MDWAQARATLGILDWEGVQSFLFSLPGQDTGLQPLFKNPVPLWEVHSPDSSAAGPSQSFSGMG